MFSGWKEMMIWVMEKTVGRKLVYSIVVMNVDLRGKENELYH